MNAIIEIPHDWRLREYQQPFWDAMHNKRRGVAVWHRRAGKDALGLNYTVKHSLLRVGLYWHLLPTQTQGRKVIWDGITKEGKRVMDAWPDELITKTRNDEMSLHLANGSMWQVVGSDNYNSLVGANPVGVVFSEFSLADPAAWDFVRPILAENGGWAIFIFTPRGRNHGYRLFRMAQDNPDWACELLTVDDTHAIPMAEIEAERAAGMPDELIQQEFYCSFDASLVGSIFGDQMAVALVEKRIGAFPHDPSYPVETWWDLGRHDSMAIVFMQRIGHRLQAIDYIEDSGKGVDHYARLLQERQREKGYVYGKHVWPHDGNTKELMTVGNKSRAEVFREWGFDCATVARPRTIQEAIDGARRLLPRVSIDEGHCGRWLDALRAYRREEDERLGDGMTPFYKAAPLHNWASHGASALMTGALYVPAGKHSGPTKPDRPPLRRLVKQRRNLKWLKPMGRERRLGGVA